jgi:hypothetical protein
VGKESGRQNDRRQVAAQRMNDWTTGRKDEGATTLAMERE